MQALLAAASSLLGSHLLHRLQLRDLQALLQTTRGLRCVVAAAPETAWCSAARLSASPHHPMLRSGCVHAYLQQQTEVHVAIAQPGSWHFGQPVILPVTAVLSPDLQLTAELDERCSLVVRPFGSALTLQAFALCPHLAAARAGIVSSESWSQDSLHVCCVVILGGRASELHHLSVHVCHLTDGTFSSWVSEQPPKLYPPKFTEAAEWTPDGTRLALLLALEGSPGVSRTPQLLVLDASGEAGAAIPFLHCLQLCNLQGCRGMQFADSSCCCVHWRVISLPPAAQRTPLND